MTLNDTALLHLQEVAKQAAISAGEIILSFRKQTLSVNKKTSGRSLASQVVCEADLASQAIILSHLKPTLKSYDLALLSEETPDDRGRFQKDYFWCIDPLDGTLPFVEGKAGFSVSIALVARDGEPIIGVVYDPSREVLYHASKAPLEETSSGTCKERGFDQDGDDDAWNNETLLVAADRSFWTHPLCDQTQTKLEGIAKQLGLDGVAIETFGGAVRNACKVLASPHACYFKYPNPKPSGGSLWDFAATAALFEAYRKPVSDIFGKKLDLNRGDSTFMNHKGVLYAGSSRLAMMIIDMASRFSAE